MLPMPFRFSLLPIVAAAGVLVACSSLIGADWNGKPLADASNGGSGALGTGGLTGGGSATASCVDGSSEDPDNCGRCGHSCLGGHCAESACQPVVIADGLRHPTDLAIAGGYVYWAERGSIESHYADGKIARASLQCSGGDSCVQDLALNQTGPAGLAVTDEGVYWVTTDLVSESGGQLVRLGFDGKAPSVLAAHQKGARKLVIDEPLIAEPRPRAAYWINGGTLGAYASGEVRRQVLDVEDMTAGVIASDQPSPTSIAIHGRWLLWSNFGASDFTGQIVRFDIDDANIMIIAENQAKPRGLAVGSTFVYWANAGNGTIVRSTMDGSELTVIASERKTPSHVALSSAAIGWVEQGEAPNYEDGAVMMADADGAHPVVLATEQHGPSRLAVTDDAVYWVNSGTDFSDRFDGAVMKVARPAASHAK